MQKMGYTKSAVELKKTLEIEPGYMEMSAYKKKLEERGLITIAPGAPHDGQHVFHIIAAANGGPDHTDNYLYALGGTFNISIGAHLDHFNCVLAGKEKARRAVAICKKTAEDPNLHIWIRSRTGKDKPLYTESKHKGKTGEDLFNEGLTLFRAIRDQARKDQAAGSSST